MSNNVKCRVENKITYIQIEDGNNGNRVSDQMAKDMTKMIETSESSCKAIVLISEGNDFCLGRAVMGESPGKLPEAYQMRGKFDLIFKFYDSFRKVKIPVIGRVQGKASGFGCAMAGLCDITIASNTSQFQLPETSHGIMPTMAMSSLVDRVGRKAISYLTYSSDYIDADHALSVGLISKVVPREELDKEVSHIVGRIRGIPMAAIHAVKEFTTYSIGQPMPNVEQYARNLHATINSSEEMRKK